MPSFRILFVADVCGRPGRQACAHMIKPLREKYEIDLVIANIENAAGGFGITPEMAVKVFSYGVDIQTSGNHIWDRVEIQEFLEQEPRLLRPANYPSGVPGRGVVVDRIGNVRVAVLNLMGRTYMKDIDCPFQMAEREVRRLREEADIIFLDFHAEATSEKQAMLYYLNGKVSAIVGSHTHVQTVDSMITDRGTAYITDAGMTGPHDSVIGMQVGPSIGRFLTGLPKRFTTATDDVKMCGVMIDFDPAARKATAIKRYRLDFDLDTFDPTTMPGIE
jgi:metallophosphoesterase (TIGR00282 family)